MSKRIKIIGGGSKKKDRALVNSQSPTLEEDLFQALSECQNYLQMLPKKVEPIRCLHNKLLTFTHLPLLLELYKPTKFLYFQANVYARLVRMFNAN